MPHHCEQCNLGFPSIARYDAHVETMKHRHLKAFLQLPEILETNQILIKVIDSKDKIIDEKNKAIEDLKVSLQKQKESYECQLDNKDKSQMKRIIAEANLITKCAVLEETNQTLFEIAKKPVNITNNNTNYKTVNKILSVISPEVIDYSKVNTYLTAEVASRGPEAMANAVHSNLLMDKNGKPKVICTDPSRNKFKIKDPITGDLIDDLNLEGIKLGIRDQIEFKQMKKNAHEVARLKATKDETPEVLALAYMKTMRLNGETGRRLKNIAKQHYIGTAKVKFGNTDNK
jgi:hypothetical protein